MLQGVIQHLHYPPNMDIALEGILGSQMDRQMLPNVLSLAIRSIEMNWHLNINHAGSWFTLYEYVGAIFL